MVMVVLLQIGAKDLTVCITMGICSVGQYTGYLQNFGHLQCWVSAVLCSALHWVSAVLGSADQWVSAVQ